MQGLWKDKRKHFLKDKRRVVYKIYALDKVKKDEKIYRVENETKLFCNHQTSFWNRCGFQTNKEFFYKKPLYKKDINWSFPKIRKFYQKLANKKDRRIIRDWIRQGDYEKSIPTHKMSKSIEWEII